MSVIHNDLLLSSDDGYNLTRSLRFRSSASAYLNRATSAGNQQIFTLSTWIKYSIRGSDSSFFSAGALNNDLFFQFNSSSGTAERLQIFGRNSSTTQFNLITSQVFRDPSSWYHIVIAFDTTQATASNRIKLYVNGSQVTAFDTSTYPSQNANININKSSSSSYIGNGLGSLNYLDGYLAEVNFIDGQALTPSSFGATSSTTGVWQPKKYTGTYGTNGFYLPFTDNSALTSGSNAGLGKDFSGNGNYWNTNNISITSGSTYDSMTDVPTLTSATASNFSVMNPLDQAGGLLVTDGNLKVTANTGWDGARATFSLPSTGKYYWETTCISRSTGATVGILSTTAVITGDLGAAATGYVYNSGDGQKYNNGSASAYGATWGTNDVIGIAWDADAGSLVFYKNGTSQGTAWTGLSGTFSPAIGVNGSDSMAANFGQRPFAYTPPTGYVALNTFNLPTPTIGATASSQANKYFDATLYTGNGTSQSVVNAGGFQPDLVWIKMRSGAAGNELFDSARGANIVLFSNATNAESNSGTMSAFNSNGFTPVYQASDVSTNNNGSTFVGWQWKANGSGSSNTAGSITSTVSANTTSGFSVVTYTGNGVDGATVGHGLGVTPKMIIIKARGAAVNWTVYNSVLGNTAGLHINTTGGSDTNSGFFNNTSPSSTTFTLGSGSTVNTNGGTYVAYCWSEIAGFSKFGSYTGNGSTDGPFIATGFKPRYIMIKRTDAAQSWWITDTARNPYNTCNLDLFANLSNAEENNGYNLDLLSNGVKIRTSTNDRNASGGTYIYMAFAENPFKYSLAR